MSDDKYIGAFDKHVFNKKFGEYSKKYGKERANKYKDKFYGELIDYGKALHEGRKDVSSPKWWEATENWADTMEARAKEWEGAETTGGDDLKGSSGMIQAQSTIQGGLPTTESNTENTTETDKDTEMTKRKSKSRGKRGFRISREQGQGLNI